MRKVGTDVFHHVGRDYLLLIDYHSNYPEVALLPDLTSKSVITHLKSMMTRHGIPRTLVSDNARYYRSAEFKSFSTLYGFQHSTSSPFYPQSNGLAERGVGIVKQMLKKATEETSDPYLALLNNRATLFEGGMSPAELIMGRKLRTSCQMHLNYRI